VRKYLLASVAVVALGSGAHAQFKAAVPQPLQQYTALECTPVASTDRNDPYPAYKIDVDLKFDDNVTSIQTMWVQHTTVSGATYVRSEQYSHGKLWQTPGRYEWFWSGVRGRVSMTGEVWRTANQEWFYSEEIFDQYHRPEFRMLSRCHSTEPKRD
jgi:hypothetical protein